MKRLTLATLALSLTGCALADPAGNPWTIDDEPTAPNQPVEPTEPDVTPVDPNKPVETDPIEPLSCALEVSQFEPTWWVEPAYNGFSPNEGLFLSAAGYDGQGVTLSLADGVTYPSNDVAGLRDVSPDWSVGVFTTYSLGGTWRDLRTDEVLYTTEDVVGEAAVSDDGRRAAFIVCDEQTTIARLVELDGATRDVELATDGYCHRWAVNYNQVAFTSDGSHLVIATMGGVLWTIDTATFATTNVTPHELLEDPERYYGTMITDMAVRPGAAEVVTTGSDGALRRWSVPSLDQIGEDVEVGRFVINEMTYAPHYTVSPVAFSPDGASMAFVNVDGDVIVRNAAGDTVLPTPAVDEDVEFERAANVPVTLSFGPSGHRIGVGYYWGPAVWGCPGEAIERGGVLSIDAPTVVDLVEGQNTIPLTIRGDGPMAALRATLNGETYYQANFVAGGITVWPRHEQPAVETIVIEADDGFATATTTIQLRFIQ